MSPSFCSRPSGSLPSPSIPLSNLVASCSQIRNRSRPEMVVIGILVVTSTVLGFFSAINGMLIPISDPITIATAVLAYIEHAAWLSSMLKYAKIWTSFTLVADMAVCGLLMWTLLRAPKNFSSTRTLLNRLMRGIMESMFPPFLCALVWSTMLLMGEPMLGP